MQNKKKFLFININGCFLGIATRIQQEGYECFSWYDSQVSDAKKIDTGKGIINLVDDPFDVLNQFREHKNELVIMVDDNSDGDLVDYLRFEGWRVIGSSHFADKTEHERGFGNDLAKKLGMKRPPTWTFSDFQALKEFLGQMKAKYPDAKLYFKGDGVDVAGGSKTYGAKDVMDMLWFIEWIEKDSEIHNYHMDKFEVQLEVPGIEADFSAWFIGETFINNIALTFEEKKVGGLGSAQGCMGQICSFEPAGKSKFFREYIAKLTPILKGRNEINEWAINTIIAKKNNMPYFLEFTPRFGWDSTIGELAILQDSGRSIADFFLTLASGKPFPPGFFPRNVFSCSVRLFSEWPQTKTDDVKGKPIHWKKSIENNLWFYHVRKDEHGYSVTDSWFGVAAATGKTIEESIEKVYKIIDPKNKLLSTPDLFYSEEIGKRAIEAYKSVKDTGWF